ncbi:hypothetical protein AAVH_14614 [Aphelenchoides avenae]|nr:hypothetical protein AAVH_14614 [Aphelenchus avenae]
MHSGDQMVPDVDTQPTVVRYLLKMAQLKAPTKYRSAVAGPSYALKSEKEAWAKLGEMLDKRDNTDGRQTNLAGLFAPDVDACAGRAPDVNSVRKTFDLLINEPLEEFTAKEYAELLVDMLAMYPPVDEKSRVFWIRALSGVEDVAQLDREGTEHTWAMRERLVAIMSNPNASSCFACFVRRLLELDFALVVARFIDNRHPSHKVYVVRSFDDFADLPLAYLLLSKFGGADDHFNEQMKPKLYTELVKRFCGAPKDYVARTAVIDFLKLCTDAQLFVWTCVYGDKKKYIDKYAGVLQQIVDDAGDKNEEVRKTLLPFLAKPSVLNLPSAPAANGAKSNSFR